MAETESRQRVAILAPMEVELRPIVRGLSLRRSASERTFWTGAMGRTEIVAVLTGIGTEAAAQQAEAVLNSGPVDYLLVVGIAGGVGSDVRIGDLVIPEVVVDLSTGARYRPHILGSGKPRGILGTSDQLIADPGEVSRLERQGIIAVDMETAAVAAVCEQRGCPWSVFRAISDRPGDVSPDPALTGLVGPRGEPRIPALLRFVVAKPGRVSQLVLLARGASLAAKVAARAAIRAI